MTNNQLSVGLVVVALVAITALFFPQAPSRLGQILDTFTGDYFNVVTANGGGAFQINGTSVISPTVLRTTTAGGTLTVVTSNSATSTASLGCVQTVATSTATPIALTFSTISTTTSMANGQTNNGFVMWKFGTCPF